MDYEHNLPYPTTNRNLIVPRYPNGAVVNQELYKELNSSEKNLEYNRQ